MAAVILAGTELGSASTVKTSSAQTIARDHARRSITFQNRSTSALYVSLSAPSVTPTEADSHLEVLAGDSITFDNYIGPLWTNAVAQTVTEFIY